ncbi:MAG: J domain-containing protein [bacterium]
MMIHYRRLGLQPGAQEREIKAAFRALAKKFHPDSPGGNGYLFGKIKDAYDALADKGRRELFERSFRPPQNIKPRPAPGRGRDPRPAGPRQNGRASSSAGNGRNPIITRLMSIAIPRAGRVLFENMETCLVVEPTTPENLWETTLRKFGRRDDGRLSNHVIQLRVTGAADQVRRIKMGATDLGVLVRPEVLVAPMDGQNSGAAMPLAVTATVPLGTSLFFRGVGGRITVGDLEGQLRAQLRGGTVLRSGRLARAGITLADLSCAFLDQVEGDADLLVRDFGRAVLDGRIGRLRAVVEKRGRMEVLGTVKRLFAEVNGRGILTAKNVVTAANCITAGQGYLRFSELKTFLAKRGTGNVEVDKSPVFVPVSRNRPSAASA